MSDEYFANKPATDCVRILADKIEKWSNGIVGMGLVEKIKRSWSFYHGSFSNELTDGNDHKILFTGDQGELLKAPVNHFRNVGTHLLNLTTSNRPAMQARAVNTDYKSLTQTVLANGLLDYYMREKSLEDVLKKATEYAIVCSEGWIKMEWDSMRGEPVAYNEETKTAIYEGDIKYDTINPLNVIRDIYRTDSADHDWLIIKSYKNRFDLAARYPELKEDILAIQTKDQENVYRFGDYAAYDTDQIPVYEFYHARTDAVPDGRYIMFMDKDVITMDTPLPYRSIPCFRIAPSDFMGTPFGYTIMFDLLPIQEAINMLYSIILTNQNAFGVQNVLVPKGADLNLSQIGGALNILEYNPGIGKPEAMNLTQTPAEIFNMLNKLESTLETISGVNSVVRGNPEASLRTGTALALVQAQALQFASGLQQSYVRLVENIGTATIKLLQDFAAAPRVAAIVGKSERPYLKEFSGKDLSNINRIAVDIANPISKSTAGRLEMANNLLQYQLLKNVDQYFTVLNTGNLQVLTEGIQNELLLIRSENEKMLDGEQVSVLALDSHLDHIKEHKSILFDPDLRKDANLVQNVLGHISEHINMLKTVDPATLQLLGEQPLPPDQPPQAPGQPPQAPGEAPEAPQPPPEQAQDSTENIEQAPATGTQAAQEVALPNMPRAAGNPEMPVTPAEQLQTKFTG